MTYRLIGNNQSFGSPVNRIKITGYWASRSQTRNRNLPFTLRLREWFHHITFQFIMFQLDLMFWKNRLELWIGDFRSRHGLYLWGSGNGGGGGGFEEELERNVRMFAKDNLGIDVANDVFEG